MTITVNASTSKKISTYQFTRLTLQSTASTVRWEIEEYPIGLNQSNVIKFEDSSNQVSISNPAYMTLILAGTYVLKATEANSTPVYIYVEAESLSNGVYLPYNGERNEIDNINGWGNKLYTGVETALMSSSNSAIIKTVADVNTKDVGSFGGSSPDLVGILAPYSNESNNIIYNGNDVVTAGLFGIIIKKYSITNSNLFGTGMDFDGKSLFQVLQFGTVVLDYDCNISVDGDGKFYYNQGIGALTTSSSDVYVGRWDSTNYILTIENPDPTNRVITASGGGSTSTNVDSIAFIDSTYSTDDPTTHTYKTFVGAVNNEPENTSFFFMVDGQSFTVSAPLTLKWGQKFYVLFTPVTGIAINFQSDVESFAKTSYTSTSSSANSFSLGIIFNIIASSTVSLAVSNSYLQINQFDYCSNFVVDSYSSIIYATIDSTSADVDLGDPTYNLHDSTFALFTTNDNASYYNSIDLYHHGDSIDGVNDFDNDITVGSDPYISVNTTQHVRLVYITVESGTPRNILVMADNIDITVDNGSIDFMYLECAGIDVYVDESGQIGYLNAYMKEYVNPAPFRRSYYSNLNNYGKIDGFIIDESPFISLPNTTHVFTDFILTLANSNSEVSYRLDLFDQLSFTATNYVGMVGMSVADDYINSNSKVLYALLNLDSDVFYTTEKYFKIGTSISNPGSYTSKPKYILSAKDGLFLSVDFGATVVGTISEKILIYTTDLLAGIYDMPFDITVDDIVINSTPDGNPRTVQIYLNNDASRGRLIDLSVKNINIPTDDISTYVCEAADSNIKLSYTDDGTGNVLYLNGERNKYIFHNVNNGTISTGSTTLTVPANLFVDKLIQDTLVDFIIDNSYINLLNCIVNDLTINAGSQHCIGLGNIINGTYTDNGSNNLFYDSVNEGGAITPPSGVLDEDDMASMSTVYPPSQSSTKNYVDNNEGRLQQITVYNNTGVQIDKGKVVTPTGYTGTYVEVELADSTIYDLSRFIGVASENIPNASSGVVYTFGELTNINTSTLSIGTAYLTTNGGLTSTQPVGENFYISVGFVTVVNATTGAIIIDPTIANLTMETSNTNGFPDDQRIATTISFDDLTRTFTIAPTGSNFHYYEKGIKYIKSTSQTFTIGALEEGPHAIYFDGDTLTDFYNPTPAQYNNIIKNNCLVSGIYWDSANAKAIYLADHRYGIDMSGATHAYLSSTVGIQYVSGIDLNTINATGDGSLDVHAQFGVDAGQLINKDLFYDTLAVGSTTGLNIFYFDTALGLLRSDTNAGFSVLTTGTGRLAYNQYSGGVYQLTECADGTYVLYHVMANADVNNPITTYVGLENFATLLEARNAAKTEIYDVEFLVTRTEVVPIATIILQTDDTYTNAVKARIVEFETGVAYKSHTLEIDTRILDSHNSLADVELAGSGVTYGHVNDGVQTIYGVKTFNSFLITPSSEPTADYEVANKKYVDENDGKIQQVTVYNGTGSTISKGKVVTPTGYDAGSGYVEVELADATKYDYSRFVGIANETIANGSTGVVYIFGTISEIDTSTLSVGPAYLTTAGNLSSTRQIGEYFDVVVGYVTISNAITGQIIVDITISEITNEVIDTNGFPGSERTNTTLSFVDGTRTFTIAPTGADFHYYQGGIKYIKTTSQSVIIDNTEGIHVIYFDGVTLTALANPTDADTDNVIRTKCIVSYLYWDATNSEQNYLADERHGISMSPQTHSYNHFSRGAQYLYGLALTDIVSSGDGSLDTHAQFGVALGGMVDEDLVTASTAITSTTGLPIYYLDGASGNLRETANAGFAVLDDVTAGVGVTGRLVYNEWTGATWQLTTVTDGYSVLGHVYILNSDNDNKKIITIIGQEEYADANTASQNITTELANLRVALPVYEIVPIGTIIFTTDSTYTNSVKAIIVPNLDGNDYKDWRETIYGNNINPISHGDLTAILGAGNNIKDGHINNDAQTLYGVKTLNSFAITPSSAPTSDYEIANKKYVDDQISILPVPIGIALSDEVSDLVAGTEVVTFRMPYAMTLTGVRASVATAPTGANIIVDINESGASVLSTKLSIDAGEKTSTTAASAPVISDSSLADDSEITIDIDQVGSTIAGAGLKIWLIGTRT